MDLALLEAAKPAFYQVVTIQGEQCLSHWNGEHWEMDATCDAVNEMLCIGMLDVYAIQGWIDQRRSGY
ncbi:hypothetical protein GCM10011348_15950 [Marinobacterium nitratireducens]|uniref:Uncharacterized protein n=1 Tax=Marinobacterium nitratireducens TaxID=518897 RepID=A0A917ZBB2_9GAMM|nr:hypothetical protein [Marinobacterium nitratireducens]GGO80073.1 hypothetical protein GCM10011348_15950 [Marinobacterium nitratireducens]